MAGLVRVVAAAWQVARAEHSAGSGGRVAASSGAHGKAAASGWDERSEAEQQNLESKNKEL